MKLSIIVPIYNEEKTISIMLDNLFKVKFSLPFEIILINDGSTDGTFQKLQKYKKKKKVILINYKQNRGKGYALRQGFKRASGDYIAIQDADLEYHPKTIPRLLQPILDKKSEVVYGDRFRKKGNTNFAIPSHYLGNKIINLLFNLLFNCSLNDIETCYKIFKKKAIDGIDFNEDRFGIEVELTANFIKKGYNIYELSIPYKARKKREGKKITWLDGIEASWLIFKYRF